MHGTILHLSMIILLYSKAYIYIYSLVLKNIRNDALFEIGLNNK